MLRLCKLIIIYIVVLMSVSISHAREEYSGQELSFAEVHAFLTGMYRRFENDATMDTEGAFRLGCIYFSFTSQLHENITTILEVDKHMWKTELELGRCEAQWRIHSLLKLTMGKFHIPFGLEPKYFYAPLNIMAFRPWAPTIMNPMQKFVWTEIGIMASGKIPVTKNMYIEYELAGGNGYGANLVPQDWDNNYNKGFCGRVGFSPHEFLTIGGSYARGKYDDGNSLGYQMTGADLNIVTSRLELRGEYMTPTIEQATTDLERTAYYIQGEFKVVKNMAVINYLAAAVRYEMRDPDKSAENAADKTRLAFGINYSPYKHLLFKCNYLIVKELHGEELDNNGIIVQTTVAF